MIRSTNPEELPDSAEKRSSFLRTRLRRLTTRSLLNFWSERPRSRRTRTINFDAVGVRDFSAIGTKSASEDDWDVAMMKAGTIVAALSLSLAVTGCSGQPAQQAARPEVPQPELKPAPATPIAEKKEELGAAQQWDPQWDVIVESSLAPEMLSAAVARDVRPFCPRFVTMSEGDKRAFWAYFFQALAGAEAGLKPTANVRHTEPEVAVKDEVTRRMVRSEGLLQLTYMDAKRYGCDFDWEADKALPEKDPAKTILQPRNNLTCGVKILENQLITLRRPLLTRSSYWSTLQPGRPSYRVFAKQMVNVPIACRKISANSAVR